MNKSKEFVKNTALLFVGKFATQFMSLLLLPLFTRYLLNENYGMVDLLQTYITLFIPILTLRIDSAVFRFLVDNRNNEDGKKKIVSNILFILFVTVLSSILVGIALLFVVKIQYKEYVLLNIIILMISNVLLQVLRGLGKIKEYSIASIITGLVTLISNVLLILVLHFDAESILIASMLSNVVCIVYIIFNVKLHKLTDRSLVEKNTLKSILKYSLPMIPNTLSWWVVDVSDRTIITIFIGAAFNGIYTVSCKFSNILNSVFSIFNMSWQESASLHINDEDRDEFFTDMINNLLFLFGCVSLVILVSIPIVFKILIGKNYYDSYEYIPVLLYANVWHVLISLIGGVYVARKETKKIAITTIISAIINLIINIALIKYIGLYAACLSTLISYMSMALYRYFDIKKYVNIKLDFKKLLLFSLIFLSSTFIYMYSNIYVVSINLLLVLLYSFMINRKSIKLCVDMLKEKVKR